MNVYLVTHAHELEFYAEHEKIIGIYSTQENAEEAINKLKLKAGFCERIEDFQIEEHIVDEDSWREGFATITHILKNGRKLVVCVPTWAKNDLEMRQKMSDEE
ncbi:DUF7336 domain-containing protein [Sphingorhabdus lutea]|nr:hypothetical protein [Sphingorhabdus lutea]